MIISVSGYAGSGKDSVGKIIQDLTHDAPEGFPKELFYSWEIKKWAGKLKTIASMLTGIPVEKFEDQDFKKTYLGSQWSTFKMKPGKRQDGIFPKKVDMELVPMTVRDFLQKLGTDGLREGLHENTWVNALMADYEGVYDIDTDRTTWPNWVITDTRFPNEAKAVKEANGITIRVERPGVTAVNAHPSETALDAWAFDYVIVNDGSMEDLTEKVSAILKQLDII